MVSWRPTPRQRIILLGTQTNWGASTHKHNMPTNCDLTVDMVYVYRWSGFFNWSLCLFVVLVLECNLCLKLYTHACACYWEWYNLFPLCSLPFCLSEHFRQIYVRSDNTVITCTSRPSASSIIVWLLGPTSKLSMKRAGIWFVASVLAQQLPTKTPSGSGGGHEKEITSTDSVFYSCREFDKDIGAHYN